MRPKASILLLVAVLVIAAGVIFAWRSARAPARTADRYDAAIPPEPLVPLAATARFAGSDACARCHRGVFESWSQSGHAHTLSPVAGSGVAARFLTRQTIRDEALGATYSCQVRDGIPIFIAVHSPDGAYQLTPPRFVIGSGKHAQTFLIERNEDYMESRLSYYPPARQWSWTPGQQEQIPVRAPLGRSLPPDELARCLLCHSTMVVREGEQVLVDRSLPNIGCERCHGPGRAHADTALAGGPSGPIYRFHNPGAETVMRLCGSCHRGPEAVPDDRLAAQPELPRFQGTALAASRCYRLSGGRLSCVTCHDPHAPLSVAETRYVGVCRACHTGAPGGWRECPENPMSGCTSCHMPVQSLGEPMQMNFHNHWIRVYRNRVSPPAAAGSVVLRGH
jgi:hypothetical protein